MYEELKLFNLEGQFVVLRLKVMEKKEIIGEVLKT